MKQQMDVAFGAMAHMMEKMMGAMIEAQLAVISEKECEFRLNY